MDALDVLTGWARAVLLQVVAQPRHSQLTIHVWEAPGHHSMLTRQVEVLARFAGTPLARQFFMKRDLGACVDQQLRLPMEWVGVS
jgi:hypothetical protein